MSDTSTDRLALLYRISQSLNSSLDLDEVLNRALDEVIAATRAERGFLMLTGADGQLAFMAARGLDHDTIAAPEFQVSRSIIERVAREGRPLLTSDAQSDAWLKARASVAGLGLRSILCVPLQVKGTTIGVTYVDNRLRAGIFNQADLDLLTSIAASAAIAIDNARLYRLAVEKGRLERELQVASEVQAGLLPHEMPELSGWEFAAYWQPARVVGGDFYDFIPDATAPTAGARKWGLVIADVSDKGMPAALFMASTRSILRASMGGHLVDDPAAALAWANRLVCADAANGMFVTLFYAALQADNPEVTYVNAGHNPPLLCRAATGELIPLTRTGLLLGFSEETDIRQERVTLAPGDLLLLYTDGLTEAVNEADEEFGEDRLRVLLQAQRSVSPTVLVAAIADELHRFSGGTPQFDDVTLLVARCKAV